ncbi:MAG TPA: response regulator [Chromatiales bacterium]|nr:response regulator [Chromatiales bacterium]
MQVEQRTHATQDNPMRNDEMVPFSEALKYLDRLCQEQRSGNLFLYTAQANGARISLSQGEIVEIKYKNLRGRDALPFMREIDRAKYIFRNDPRLREKRLNADTLLPSNDIIFLELGMKTGAIRTKLASTGKRKKILVVEDSAMARKTVVNILLAKGYDVMEARDGLEALIKLEKMTPDIVLLDLILPRMDGYEVLNVMKKEKKTKNIPVIALTSRDALFDKLKGKMSGTDEYLTKPIKSNELLKKLHKYLG